ncbi:glycoside hydrolase family protein [Crateriforma spongiae]|uniref:glycosyl hydrolase n=1 Tax=Crateriforma spongiae TaxID=2724528 RepID=UPI001446FE35|nr:glycosyl hydrolase [Crateriforma spongiae]
MYSESAGTRKTLGDVDVLYHDGIYHLFHLVLPNHDFIAHAVSNNCLQWRRVENALFLGDPGGWDDSMLWTIHVTPDPHKPGSWRMFYTGLSRRDQGSKQRIGMAVSDDLYHWTKAPVNWKDRRSPLPYELPGRPPQPPFSYNPDSCFPLDPDPQYYESDVCEGRHWISWRDPFFYQDDEHRWLLAAGRIKDGPVVRRGCVARMEEVAPNQFEARPPLYHPGLYDDVEVPNLIKIDGEYYLIGSLREDAKIRYWHTRDVDAPWRSYADNVLLASGNYAGRVCADDEGYLLFSFFTPGGVDRVTFNLMPPPKRLVRRSTGHLEVRSFERFDEFVDGTIDTTQLQPLDLGRESNVECRQSGGLMCECLSGFQGFVLPQNVSCFRLDAELEMLDSGKCGILFRIDRDTRDGYYLSLDLFKGVAQFRSWGSNGEGSGEEMMRFDSLQSGYWQNETPGKAKVRLLAFGSYLEFSIGDKVILSLADKAFSKGAAGFYIESGQLLVDHLHVDKLTPPLQTDEHLANG